VVSRWPLEGVGRLCCLWSLLAAGCPAPLPPREPVGLSLQIATRQSCGVLSGLDYDTSCLGAVYARIVDDTNATIVEQCATLTDAPSELGALLRGDALLSLGGVSTNRAQVRFEVRGLHAATLDADALCDDAGNDDHWLFWGASDVIDLSAFDKDPAPSPVVPVFVDCRDCTFACEGQTCFGCGGFGALCPSALPPSVCVPTSTCDRSCDSDEECFPGAPSCIGNSCTSTGAPNGDTCAPCSSSADCVGAVGRCVVRNNAAVGVCAPLCPAEF
jgi:hypothetical protein